jgi:3',5'-cyclic AMP phosphodiesterase CpdA
MRSKHYLTIGDLHGRRTWYHAVTPWVTTSPDHLVVFLGDYCDSRTLSVAEQRDNLTEVLAFKRLYPTQVVLLLGNHDAHYLWADAPRGSGFSVAGHAALFPILRENEGLFQVAFQHDTPDGQHYLWTHAGISAPWLASVPPFACETGADGEPLVLADVLNYMADTGRMRGALLAMGSARGGRGSGGPLWADASELELPLQGYHQIVGHTALPDAWPLICPGDTATSAVFCDYNHHARSDVRVGAEWFYQITLEL